MRSNKIIVLFFLIFWQIFFGQKTNQIKGKIVSESSIAQGIQVLNLVTEQSVFSNEFGIFTIDAKAEDMLVFISPKYIYKRYFVEKEDFSNSNLTIELEKVAIQLNEVKIQNNSKITTENLGIVPIGQKTYTPAERRLKTAGEFKPTAMIGLLAGVTMPVDPILNAISGRTSMLKKEVVVERNEINLERLNNLFEESYYIKRFKLEQYDIKSFKYFCIEDSEFVTALNSKNKSLIKFLMSKLAVKFKTTLTNEKSD